MMAKMRKLSLNVTYNSTGTELLQDFQTAETFALLPELKQQLMQLTFHNSHLEPSTVQLLLNLLFAFDLHSYVSGVSVLMRAIIHASLLGYRHFWLQRQSLWKDNDPPITEVETISNHVSDRDVLQIKPFTVQTTEMGIDMLSLCQKTLLFSAGMATCILPLLQFLLVYAYVQCIANKAFVIDSEPCRTYS